MFNNDNNPLTLVLTCVLNDTLLTTLTLTFVCFVRIGLTGETRRRLQAWHQGWMTFLQSHYGHRRVETSRRLQFAK